MKKIGLTFLLTISFTVTGFGQVTCNSILGQFEIRDLVNVGSSIWACTNGGLVKYDTATYQKTYYNKTNSNIPQNELQKIEVDASGNLWILTDAGLLLKYNGATFTSYDFTEVSFSPSNTQAGGLTIIGNNVYIMASDQRLYCFNGTTWSSFDITYGSQKYLFDVGEIYSFQSSVFMSLFVYDYSGPGSTVNYYMEFVKFDGTQCSLVKEFLANDDGGGSNSKTITTKFILDDQGNFWISLFEGAFLRMDHADQTVIRYDIPNNVRNCPAIYIATFTFKNGILYMGGIGKNALIFYDTVHNTWNSINESNSNMPDSDLISIVFLSSNIIYIGNDKEIVRTDLTSKACTVHNLNSLENKFDFSTGYTFRVFDNNVYFSGEQYFGANDSIKVYNIGNDSWKTYRDYGGFVAKANTFVKDNSGKLWIATRLGLYYLDAPSDEWVQYTASLADTLTEVYDMLFDKNNNIWLTTTTQVIKIDADGTIHSLYTVPYFSGYRGPTMCYDKNNLVYISSGPAVNQGILKINISSNNISYLNTDNYGYSIDCATRLLFANDTVYYADWNTIGKVVGNQLIRKFEVTDYASPIAHRTPTTALDDFAVDQNGKIWMLDQQSNKLFTYNGTAFDTYDYTNSCLSSNMYRLSSDDQNRIWVEANGLYEIQNAYTVTAIDQSQDNNGSSPTGAFIYPNPLSDEAHVQWTNHTNDIQSISIQDMRSSETTTINEYNLSENQIELKLSYLKQGMYILKIRTSDDKVEVVKFIKM